MENNDFVIENNVLTKYKGKGADVVIPECVKEIGECAFCGCDSLTSINIPDSITKIGECAFCGCDSLTSIIIPNSVKEIGEEAFYGCINLSSIIISDSVTKIGVRAFDHTKTNRQPHDNIAYKGFNADMTCRSFQYKEGETYICEDAKLCEYGFHACLNPMDCFNYYAGEHVVYHEVILKERTGETINRDSKICGQKITIGRRLTLKEMGEIFNELNK